MENTNYVFRRNLLIPAAEAAADTARLEHQKLTPTASDDDLDAVWNRVFHGEMQENSKALESALD
jgi:hypothetical protein